MKVLFNKLKKVPKVLLVIYILTMIAYLTGYIFLVINLIHLTGIETFWRIILIIVLGLWFIIYFFWNLINLILKKKASFIITTILSIILVVLFGIGSYYIGVINKGISNLTEKAYVTYTANLVTLKDTVIDKDSILGMINSSDDIEGNVLAKELIKKENLTNNKVNTYASYYEMIDDLLNGEVDGIFLNSNYLTIFGEEEGFEKLKDTVVAYTYSKKMENKDTKIVSNKSLTEPFTVLLMGVDSTPEFCS